MHFLYNILFFPVFLCFLPFQIVKLIRRPGEKRNIGERLGIYAAEKKKVLETFRGSVWLHAVSVGEANLALTVIREWKKRRPSLKFVISTTTTTAQELVRKRLPADTELIFCPLDFPLIVKRVYDLIHPCGLAIMETELWPNLIREARKRGLPVALINGRMSDRSFKGYYRFRIFFAPLLEQLTSLCVQTGCDKERYLAVAPRLEGRVAIGGNIKFDQRPPANLKLPDLEEVFGKGDYTVILGASTHPEEEKFIAEAWSRIRNEFPESRLVIVPRHAERGRELLNSLSNMGLKVHRRSGEAKPQGNADCLLADTTGELMGFIASAHIVVMGKTLAGNNEGQNIIEPAVMGKSIVCGMELRNFRQALDLLVKADGVCRVSTQDELADALKKLMSDPAAREGLGKRAKAAMDASSGAIVKNIDILEKAFFSHE